MTRWRDGLRLDVHAEVEKIAGQVRSQVGKELRRRGVVVGLSGGIDSTVTAALCVRALGKERVHGLLMPEGESADETVGLGQTVADHLGIVAELEDISGLLEAAGCYARRDAAIRSVVPEYGEGWRSKIVLPSVVDNDQYRISSLVVQSPTGEQRTVRLSPSAYLEIVAATNFKQRCRKMLEYFHADRLSFAVAGTPNRLEYDQGFFVKNGDGSADLKPIAHLYKSQVYAIAAALELPESIRSRPPTTDTYSLPQSQEEFYFSLPHEAMDLCLYAYNHDAPPREVGDELGLSEEAVRRVYRDIESKRRATRYLHLRPLLAEEVLEVGE